MPLFLLSWLILVVSCLTVLSQSSLMTNQTIIQNRHIIEHKLGIQVYSQGNFNSTNVQTTWYRTPLHVNIGGPGKSGITFFSLHYEKQFPIQLIFWRDDGFYLHSSYVSPQSTISDIKLIGKLDDPDETDWTFGTKAFDVLGDFQNITFNLNISSFGNSLWDQFNVTLITTSVNPFNLSNGGTYNLSDIIDERIGVKFVDMMPGFWFLWNHISFRWEVANIFFFPLSLFFYIVIGVFLIIFAQKQPLKSRGMVPHVSNMINLLILLPSLRNLISASVRSQLGCILNIVFSNPMNITMAICGVMVYFRYNTMRIMNKKKLQIVTKQAGAGNARGILMKFGEVSQKWYFQLLILFLIYLALAALHIILGLLTMMPGFQDCTSDRYITIVIAVFVVLLMMLNIPMDLSISWKHIKKCKCKQLLSDTLGFQFEVYFLYMCTAIYIILNQTFTGRELTPGSWWKIILFSLQYHLIHISQVLWPLSLTIYRWIRFSCVLTKPVKDKLSEILSDPVGMKMMYKFAKSEFAAENVLCYRDILAYEKEEDYDTRGRLSLKIFQLYFTPRQSPLEVNCPKSVIVRIKEEIGKQKYVPTLFDKARSVLLDNMSDTYSRWMTTSEFRTYKKESEFLKDLDINTSKPDYQRLRFSTQINTLKEPLMQSVDNSAQPSE